jgi:hypothetical protein
MSHFSVLVHVPASVPPSSLEEAVSQLMLPYKEAHCGADDPPELTQYLTFQDIEDEYLSKYQTETSSLVRLADGSVLSAYDDRLRNPELFGRPQFLVPSDATAFEMPHQQRYATFEAFMDDYCGYKERDPQQGRYGYWQNSQCKWDYWTMGGRWTGFFRSDYDPAKDPANQEACFLCSGTGVRTHRPPPNSPPSWPVLDVSCNGCAGTGIRLVFPSKFRPVGNTIRLADLDLDRLHQEALERLDTFFQKWESFCEGQHQEDEGLRGDALRMGLLEVKEQSELTGKEWKVVPWDTPETPPEERRHRCDVLVPTTREWLRDHYLDMFHPLYTHARLDASGWQEVGRMGWWGSMDTAPARTETYVRDLRPWLQRGDPQDWLVIVDAHI